MADNTTAATEAVLSELHGEVARVLKVGMQPEPIVIDGEVVGYKSNAAMVNVARQFLKDNNIQALIGSSKPLKNLVDSLPDFSDSSSFTAGQQYSN